MPEGARRRYRSGVVGALLVGVTGMLGWALADPTTRGWVTPDGTVAFVDNPHGGGAGIDFAHSKPHQRYFVGTQGLCLLKGGPVEVVDVEPVGRVGDITVTGWSTHDSVRGTAGTDHPLTALQRRSHRVDRPCELGPGGNTPLAVEFERGERWGTIAGFRAHLSNGQTRVVPFSVGLCIRGEKKCEVDEIAHHPGDEWRPHIEPTYLDLPTPVPDPSG